MGCPARDAGEPHEVGFNRTGMSVCQHCYAPSQEFCAPNGSNMIAGFFRVICEGPVGSDSTACPIGPGYPHATPKMAVEDIKEHQEEAEEIDGCRHEAKIVQL